MLRRSFCALVAVLAVLTSVAQAAPSADLVILQADVRTMEATKPRATAIAVRVGRIVEVGDTARVKALVGPRTHVIDARGRVVVPGFIDAHLHPQPVFDEMGPFGVLDLTPEGGVSSRETLFAKLRAKAAVTPEGGIVHGRGYNDNLVGGHPTARELDAVVPRHVVILRHSSGHRQVVNSLALARAGITRATPDPDGGQIGRDEDGEPNGVILERAASLFARLWDQAPRPDRSALVEAYRKQFEAFAEQGLTSVGVAGADAEQAEIFRRLRQTGMPVQIYVMMRGEAGIDWLIANRARPEWQSDGLTFRTVKLFHGNSLSGRTAWLYEPYAHDPSYFGIPPSASQEQLNTLIQKAHEAGLQIAVHSNGDREIDMTLTAFEAAQAKTPLGGARHRIEHASVVNQAILNRVKRGGVALAPHSYILNHGEKMEEFGAARWPWMHPSRRALDMDILVGGTSDSPVSPALVMQRIQSLVTRRARSNGKVYGDGQQLTVEEALRVWTLGSAALQFEDVEKGSIKPGKRADLVVLAADPFKADPERIQDIAVDMTIIGGAIVFDRAKR